MHEITRFRSGLGPCWGSWRRSPRPLVGWGGKHRLYIPLPRRRSIFPPSAPSFCFWSPFSPFRLILTLIIPLFFCYLFRVTDIDYIIRASAVTPKSRNYNDYYRAMLCIARTMLCKMSVRPSVCPSATRRYFVETTKLIIKLFSPSGSHTILVFPHQRVWQYSVGDPLIGAPNARAMKNGDFRPISCFILEMTQDRAIVTMEGE